MKPLVFFQTPGLGLQWMWMALWCESWPPPCCSAKRLSHVPFTCRKTHHLWLNRFEIRSQARGVPRRNLFVLARGTDCYISEREWVDSPRTLSMMKTVWTHWSQVSGQGSLLVALHKMAIYLKDEKQFPSLPISADTSQHLSFIPLRVYAALALCNRILVEFNSRDGSAPENTLDHLWRPQSPLPKTKGFF